MSCRDALAYAAVARAALGFSLKLARVARGDADAADEKGIEAASVSLAGILADSSAAMVGAEDIRRSALFSGPEGLRVTITASEELLSEDGDAEEDILQPLANQLAKLVNQLRSRDTTAARTTAIKLSRVFRRIHDRAKVLSTRRD